MAKGNNNLPAPSPPPQTQPFPPELLGRFLDVQQQEIKLRTDELSLRTQQDKHNKEIAEKSISANLTDREHDRAHTRGMAKLILSAVVGLSIVVAFVICYALFSGKEAVAKDIIQALILVSSGGAGGYAIGAKGKRKEETKQE